MPFARYLPHALYFLFSRTPSISRSTRRARWPALLATLFMTAVAPHAHAVFPDDYAGFVVANNGVPAKTLSALLAAGETRILLPQAVYQIDNPITIDTSQSLVIHGAGRMKTKIEGIHPDQPLFIFTNGGSVSLAGIEFKKQYGSLVTLAEQDLEFTGTAAFDVEIMDSYVRAGSLDIEAPGKWVVQGSHFDGGYTKGAVTDRVANGILLDNLGASLFVVGGNITRTGTSHIEQISGHLEIYGTAMQDHLAGAGKADIIIRSPSPYANHAHIVAGIRSEGNKTDGSIPANVVYVPTTAAAVDIVMKANWLSTSSAATFCTTSDSLLDYNGAGRVWLLGNLGSKNTVHMAMGAGSGTIYSMGNASLYCEATTGGEYFQKSGGLQVQYMDDMARTTTASGPFAFIQGDVDWSTGAAAFVPQNINSGAIPVLHRPSLASLPTGFLINACPGGATGCDLAAVMTSLATPNNDNQTNLYIPAGTYTIAAPLVFNQEAVRTVGGMIAGAGKGQTIIRCVGCSSVLSTAGLQFVTVQGITFELVGTTGSAISLEWPAATGTNYATTQGNNFYDVETVGGQYGVSIGADSEKQCSENLFVDSVFRSASSVAAAIGKSNALSNAFHHVEFRDSPYAVGATVLGSGRAGTWNVFSATADNISTALVNASGDGRNLYYNEMTGNAASLLAKSNNGNPFSHFFDNSDLTITSAGHVVSYESNQGINFLRTHVAGGTDYLNFSKDNYIHSILSDIEHLATSASTTFRRRFLGTLDDDSDRDGIETSSDNCPYDANPLQDDACQHGLTAFYFNDYDIDASGDIDPDEHLQGLPVVNTVDDNIYFDWQLYSPQPGVNADYFSAMWVGRLMAPNYTGTYHLCLLGDDGYRLWVNDVPMFDDDNEEHWKPQDSVSDCVDVELTAGKWVPIRLDFFDLQEEAIIKLTWSYPGQAEVAVPKSALYAQ